MITFSLFEIVAMFLLGYIGFLLTMQTGLQYYHEYIIQKQTKLLRNVVFTQQPGLTNLPSSQHGPTPTVKVPETVYGMYP